MESVIFKDLDAKAKKAAEEIFKERSLEAGQMLREEGKKYDSAFFLLDGKIGVHKRSTQGEDLEVAQIKGGEDIFFSMTSLFDLGESLTTLKTVESSKIAEISSKEFSRFCRDNPQIGVKLMENCAAMLANFLRRSDGKIAELYKTLEEVL